jgi:hypothetical protein
MLKVILSQLSSIAARRSHVRMRVTVPVLQPLSDSRGIRDSFDFGARFLYHSRLVAEFPSLIHRLWYLLVVGVTFDTYTVMRVLVGEGFQSGKCFFMRPDAACEADSFPARQGSPFFFRQTSSCRIKGWDPTSRGFG